MGDNEKGRMQRAGIELVRRLAPDALIEIWCPPETDLQEGEVYCTFEGADDQRYVRTIFHVRAVPSADGWLCLACGSSRTEPTAKA